MNSMKNYDDLVAKLQKKVQVNPRDAETWMEMVKLCEEAICEGVDVARWMKARRPMIQQANLLGANLKLRIREIVLAGGCFWGAEHYLKLVKGVVATEVGYANGNTENPTYQEVYTDATGFAEAVHVWYDSERLKLERLLELYFVAIDPTSVNQQGPDKGTRYRTGIYYMDKADVATIEAVMKQEDAKYEELIEVEMLPLKNFYRAEDYHQDYLDKNEDGYCHLPLDLFEWVKNQD